MIMVIVGGRGTGKTLFLSYLAYQDLCNGKKLLTNIKFMPSVERRFKDNITYLTTKKMETMLQDLHDKKLNLQNSTIALQELHNVIDSRKSMSKGNILVSAFILQSRHAGRPLLDSKGRYISNTSLDILGDTQFLGQVDIRLRRNCDIIAQPKITKLDEKTHKPVEIRVSFTENVGFNKVKFGIGVFDVHEIPNIYDSWEMVAI
jgi:archaellum biogenesis ATPase FlaH